MKGGEDDEAELRMHYPPPPLAAKACQTDAADKLPAPAAAAGADAAAAGQRPRLGGGASSDK
eukprot:4818211-Pyramimonas_sp.AAC.1